MNKIEEWVKGDSFKEDSDDYWPAGIDQTGVGKHISSTGVWSDRIICCGRTKEEAIALRDKVLAAMQSSESLKE